MGIKEKILKLIIESDGLSFDGILKKYKKEYNTELIESSAYKFLQRLRDDKMIITENHYYKPTAKGKDYQINDEEFLKRLLEKGAMKVYRDKVSQDDIERLKVM